MKESEYKESFQAKTSLNDNELADNLFKTNKDSIIKKWLNLQKIVKESQNLEMSIEKQNSDNYEKIKKYILDFYKLKIKSRKLYEDIKSFRNESKLKNKSNNNKDYYVIESNKNYFDTALQFIKNLLRRIRKYYDYVPTIVSLIDENDEKEEIESLAEFFCNQFYNNILIPNPEHEELLICIYKLLEQEINKMDFADVENFLEDSTFIGKFMTAFSKQKELNNFFVNLLSKVFSEVDKRNNFLLDLSLEKMIKYIKKDREEKKYGTPFEMTNAYSEKDLGKEDEKGISPIEAILEKIPKTKINFKKHFILEDDILRDSQISTKDLLSLYSDDIDFELEGETQSEINDYNTDYRYDLTEKVLLQKMKNFFDTDSISFYKHLINQLNKNYHNQYAFANTNFFLILRDEYYIDDKSILAKIYLRNFLFIQEQVEYIIQSLINTINNIPYAFKCICIIIDKLIGKRFPKLPKYLRHSFIGKFLFNKCIFPILNLENTNGLKNIIFNNSQIKCLNCIVNVISNANNCKLFDIYNDVEKTMFNYYLLEIIPILNNFYDKLIDMQLPNQLTELIDDSKVIENFDLSKNIILFKPNENNQLNKNIDNNKQKYDYFKENPDEIIRISTVCFNEKDILFIIKLINKNNDLFKNLPEFDKVKEALKEKCMEELEMNIYFQKEIREKNGVDIENKGEGYYIFFYNEQNPELKYKLKEFNEEKIKKKNKEKSLIRMKNSIKTILGRINLLNVKEYSYLNYATSNEKFFQAINYTLKDFEENDEKVPLKWYSKSIINEKNQIEQDYQKNDFEKLYEEMLSEEKNYLNKLKLVNSLINAREAMNLNCAENALEKMEYHTKILVNSKNLEKVKIFISSDKTEVCVCSVESKSIQYSKTINDERFDDRIDNKKGGYIQVNSKEKCVHRVMQFLANNDRNSNTNSHAKSVRDFIYKLIRPKYAIYQTLIKYMKEDIEKGNNHKIYMLFDQYKELLKQSLEKNFKNIIEDENDPENIMKEIEDYILRKIYKYIFPVEPLYEDQKFFGVTNLYDWLQATDFSIKENIPLEAIQDSIYYLEQMEEKANSVSEKINCLKMVYLNINKINEFYFDSKEKGADDQVGIFNYIILKSHPKKFISNINYIKCFINLEKNYEFKPLIEDCLSSVEFLYKINPSNLKMTYKEFNEKLKSSSKK